MNSNIISTRMMVGAAVVGLVGAAGMFLYEQIYAEKRRAMLVKQVAKLDRQVMSMRTELETIRELQKESQLRRQKQKKRVRKPPVPKDTGDAVDGREPPSYASDSEYYTDYQSIVGTDAEMDSEEFYDVHTDDDDSDDTLKDSLKNGHGGGGVFDEDISEISQSPKKTSKST